MIARTSSSPSFRPSAMPRTIWPKMRRAILELASLCAAVNFFSVKVFIAFLYSYRWPMRGDDPQLVERAAEKGALGDEAGEADVARGLDVDLVEGGGEVVAAVAGTELPEGLREGHRGLLLRAEGEDGVPELLRGGGSESPSSCPEGCDEPRNLGVVARLLQRVQHRAQGGAVPQRELGDGVVGHALEQPPLQVYLEQGVRGNPRFHQLAHARDHDARQRREHYQAAHDHQNPSEQSLHRRPPTFP